LSQAKKPFRPSACESTIKKVVKIRASIIDDGRRDACPRTMPAARRPFRDQALTELTVAIGLINLRNRVQVGFRAIHPVKTVKAAQ
jgi:alkylhydroperoxidase family enzyme